MFTKLSKTSINLPRIYDETSYVLPSFRELQVSITFILCKISSTYNTLRYQPLTSIPDASLLPPLPTLKKLGTVISQLENLNKYTNHVTYHLNFAEI